MIILVDFITHLSPYMYFPDTDIRIYHTLSISDFWILLIYSYMFQFISQKSVNISPFLTLMTWCACFCQFTSHYMDGSHTSTYPMSYLTFDKVSVSILVSYSWEILISLLVWPPGTVKEFLKTFWNSVNVMFEYHQLDIKTLKSDFFGHSSFHTGPNHMRFFADSSYDVYLLTYKPRIKFPCLYMPELPEMVISWKIGTS